MVHFETSTHRDKLKFALEINRFEENKPPYPHLQNLAKGSKDTKMQAVNKSVHRYPQRKTKKSIL